MKRDKMSIKKILTVDDYPLAAYTTKRIIKAFSSHTCEIEDFENPIILLDVFRDNYQDIDMVITDYEMPGLRGDQLIKELREIKPSIKIVVISAWLDSTSGDGQHLIEKEVKALSPNLILSKPFPDGWIETLDKILDEE